MSTVAALSELPCIIEAGTTVRWSAGHSDYPATLWTLAVVFNNGLDAPTSVAGVQNGTNFDLVLMAAVSATLKAVQYQWAEIYTAISPATEKGLGDVGIVEVLPNFATTTTPSFAQQQVTLLEGAIAAFGGNTYVSVSFNGQSFSRGDIGSYRSQLTFWQARAIAERRRLAQLRGTYAGGHIPVRFVNGATEERCCDTW